MGEERYMIDTGEIEAALRGDTIARLPYDVVLAMADRPQDTRMDCMWYFVSLLRCRVCGFEHEAAWPEKMAQETANSQQCPECMHMTAEPICETQ